MHLNGSVRCILLVHPGVRVHILMDLGGAVCRGSTAADQENHKNESQTKGGT